MRPLLLLLGALLVLALTPLLLFRRLESSNQQSLEATSPAADPKTKPRPRRASAEEQLQGFRQQEDVVNRSCVRRCENGTTIRVAVPKDVWTRHCAAQQSQAAKKAPQCSLNQFAISNPAYDRLILANHTSEAACDSDGFMACPLPFSSDCIDHCWNEWTATLSLHTYSTKKHIYNLHLLPKRPFRIVAVYPPPESGIDTHIRPVTASDVFGGLDLDPTAAQDSNLANHIRVVSYYLPNAVRVDRCNTIYCIYEFPDGRLEALPAHPGDISLAFCPLPASLALPAMSNLTSSMLQKVSLRLSYDFETLSEPYYLKMEQPATSVDRPNTNSTNNQGGMKLPFVYMSICAMVRKEGRNLLEWLEFHRLMGYERFILYDNNDPSDPDKLMEHILSKYSDGIVVLIKWPYNHSQTEALTDCIQRFRHTTEWMTFVDVDEFVAPARKFRSVKHALENIPNDEIYLHSDWMTFGPCGKSARKDRELVIDLCRNVTKPTSYSPKPTFRIRHAMSVQGYGPHYIRLWADRAVRTRSQSEYVSGHLIINHYRYRSWEEFVARRKGPTAGRVMVWDDERLTSEWNKALSFNKPLSKNAQRIVRFIPALKKRMRSL